MTESLTVRLLDIWYQNDAMPVREIEKPLWQPVHDWFHCYLAEHSFRNGLTRAPYWLELPPHQAAKQRPVFGETP